MKIQQKPMRVKQLKSNHLVLDVLTQGNKKIGLDTKDKIDLNNVAGLIQFLPSSFLVLRLSGCNDQSTGAVQVIKMADHLHHMANLGKKFAKKTLNNF